MSTPEPRQTRVVLTVDPERFADVSRALRDAGLTVESEQPRICTITGIAAENTISVLETVDGVEAVERERRVGIAPPESPIQ